MLLKGAKYFKFWVNFSILRTFPKLCYHKTAPEVLTRCNPLDKSEEEELSIKQQIMIEEELLAIKGLNVISFIMLMLLGAILLNMDMVTQNSWTTFQLLENSKWKWVTGSMVYLQIDFILMFIAMI